MSRCLISAVGTYADRSIRGAYEVIKDIYAKRCERRHASIRNVVRTRSSRTNTQRGADVDTQRIRNAVRTRSSRTFNLRNSVRTGIERYATRCLRDLEIRNAVRTSARNVYATRCVRGDLGELRNAVRTDG